MKDKLDRRSRAKRIFWRVQLCMLILLFLAFVGAFIFINHMLNKINKVNPELEYTLSSSEADAFLESDPDLVTLAPGSTETYIKLEDITFPPLIWETLYPTVPTAPMPSTSESATTPSTTVPTPPQTGSVPPITVPTQPATQPTEPTTQPTQPTTQPTQPTTRPTEPTTQPTQPTTQPTQPTTRPTEPTTQPTQPATQPTEPTTQPTQPTTQPTEPTTQPTQPTTQPSDSSSSLDDIFGDHLINILLIGQDRRPGQGRQRSDTMILVSINKSNNTITLTSFMRDQYVQIPGYKPNKLNAAFAFGGMNLLKKTLELNFGVKIDGMVEVDLSGFENVIDRLGGVDVTLTKAEAKYLNDLYEAKFLDAPVVVGKNHLNAKQALVYAQLREIDSDYQRTNRQRKLIAGVIEAYKDLPLNQMLALMNDILPMVSTNLTNAQILNYAVDIFPMLSSAKVQTLRIPVDGTFVGGMVEVRPGFYGWFQYNIDFEANRKILWEIFRRRS